MIRKSRTRTDTLEQEIERALQPGEFISDRKCFSFTSDLDEVAATIATLTETDPAQAVTLYETFLAGCYEKAGEIDDSSGSFGMFVDELFSGWITARQAHSADPDETASRLLRWMDDDDYGFCHDLEKDAVKVLNEAGLTAFIKQVRERFDAAGVAKPTLHGLSKDRREYERRRWGGALRTLYLAQKNLEAYVAFAEETGLTGEDCLAIATLLVAGGSPESALDWVERGIDLAKKAPHGSIAGFDLTRLQRELLTKLGRGKEALDAAWSDYRKRPSRFTYDDLMKFVPTAERTKWHQKAIEAAEGADLYSLLELLLATGELERLADLVRQTHDSALEILSHTTTEPAAKKLEEAYLDLAARLWMSQGMRIVNAKKSKYYAAALSNFESAKRCFERAGLDAEWEKTVSRVRADHHRKTGFMPGFEELVAGKGSPKKMSFLEQAKAHWGKERRSDR